MFSLISACVFAFVVTASVTTAQAATTLEKVKATHSLACGVDFEEAEYSTQDAHGNHSAFDLDVCKAIAVAILGKDATFTAVPFRDEQDALAALKSGAIAVLASGSPNFMNTAAAGLGFTRPIFYDYQGFLVNTAMGIHSSKDLAGKKTCFISGTEIETQIQGYMKREAIAWLPFPFQEEGEMEAAFITNNCAAITADVSQLAYERIAFKGMAPHFVILPDVVAKDPLAVTYRLDDPQWGTLMNWIVDALIQAEESGVTRQNVETMKKSDDPLVARLLGTQKGYAQYLGLDDAWAAREIQAVGNYGELFNRDLGDASIMKLDRGANNLWTHGGLMVAAPQR